MDPDNGSSLSTGQSGFRFLIEVAALICWGIAGWNLTDGTARWVLVVALPLLAAITWGTFRAPDDHSANGEAPVPVPGIVRLFIELDLLLGAAVVIAVVWRPVVGAVLAAAVVLHYSMTTDRVRWLLAQHTAR